ncbi:MAG: serine/threonine protein kinase [Planctomycetota bacterium]|nr:MAG: serine/threonine protein kinase [Planctomycetota bacterium]
MTRITRSEMVFAARYLSIGALSLLLGTTTLHGGEWASWRGPEQNGNVREKAVVTKWSPDGENLLWKTPEGGRTTPLVMNGRIFYIGPVGDGECLQERVICVEADTGKTIWDYHFNVFFSEIVANRVGWTALAGDSETGNVYAHGTGGEFICFDRDGKIVWSHSLTEEYNRISGYGGRLHTPVVDEERVIVSFLNTNWGNQARPAHRYVAFDKRTGDVLWWSEIPGVAVDTTYSCPVVTVVDGRRQLICPAADGVVYGMEARTGRILWSFKLTKMGCNSSPVVDGKLVYVSHSEENIDNTMMGRLVCIDASKSGDITKTGEVWRLDGLDAGYASPALANGRIYHIDNSANLHCINARSGEHIWKFKLGRVGKGSAVVTADGVIYAGEQNGVFWILRDAGDKCEELCKIAFQGPDQTVDELYGSPAIVGGRVYFMTRYGMYCLGAKGQVPETEPIPPMPAERSGGGQKAVTAHIVPGDVTLAPGATLQCAVRLFGDSGARIDGPTPKVEWTLSGVKGEINADGVFTASPDAWFSAGTISAKVGDLTAAARIRVSPGLPIKEDFENMTEGAVPPGWSGVMGKTKIVSRDGSKAFVKLAEKGKPSPVWKMRAYMGQPVPAGYTVQADMLGTVARKRFRPDMGIINARYELVALGQQRELELSRWRDEPAHALRKRVPFEFKPDTWYRAKLVVDVNEGKALVRGRIWPRDEKEPEGWTIEFEDPCPNLAGSPGLFVYSNGTTDKSDGPEVYFDNLMVTNNE